MNQFTSKGVKQINNRISLNMTFTFTIRISRHFSSAREFQMGNFQKYWSQNVGQDFMYLIFFTGGRFWKLTEGTLKIGRKMLPPEGSHVCAKQLCYYTHNIPFMQCGVFLYRQTLIINGYLHNKIVLSVHFVITCIVETINYNETSFHWITYIHIV